MLDEIAVELPAGSYTVESLEESISGKSFEAFRCLETLLVSHPKRGETKPAKFWTIDPEELAAALTRDGARSHEGAACGGSAGNQGSGQNVRGDST